MIAADADHLRSIVPTAGLSRTRPYFGPYFSVAP